MKVYNLVCAYGCVSDTDILRALADAKHISTLCGTCTVCEDATGECRAIYENGKTVFSA